MAFLPAKFHSNNREHLKETRIYLVYNDCMSAYEALLVKQWNYDQTGITCRKFLCEFDMPLKKSTSHHKQKTKIFFITDIVFSKNTVLVFGSCEITKKR